MAISLKSLEKTGQISKPPRMVIYGPHKIGKSTFGSMAPNPVFILTEDGLDNIKATAFPLCKSYQDIMDAIQALAMEKHKHGAVVLDSLDWAERLIHELVVQNANKESVKHISDIGYQKGYAEALLYWNELLKALNYLREEKNMAVILLAHHEIAKFESPDLDTYDRYQIKLHKHASALVQEWADIIGFANYHVLTKTAGKDFNQNDKHKAIATDQRFLHLVESPTHVAGNRFGLPKSIDFDWNSFSKELGNAIKASNK